MEKPEALKKPCVILVALFAPLLLGLAAEDDTRLFHYGGLPKDFSAKYSLWEKLTKADTVGKELAWEEISMPRLQVSWHLLERPVDTHSPDPQPKSNPGTGHPLYQVKGECQGFSWRVSDPTKLGDAQKKLYEHQPKIFDFVMELGAETGSVLAAPTMNMDKDADPGWKNAIAPRIEQMVVMLLMPYPKNPDDIKVGTKWQSWSKDRRASLTMVLKELKTIDGQKVAVIDLLAPQDEAVAGKSDLSGSCVMNEKGLLYELKTRSKSQVPLAGQGTTIKEVQFTSLPTKSK
jgi:hypothetical protein